MLAADYKVRPINPDDDFELIEALFYETHFEGIKETMLKQGISYRKENWKQILFPDLEEDKQAILKSLVSAGFVAATDGVILAFAIVGVSPQTRNGYVDYGFKLNCDQMLEELVKYCGGVVKKAGGNKLYQTPSLPMGQIRNDQILLLESCGFRSNAFYHVFVDNRNLNTWHPSVDIDLSSIQLPTKVEIKEIPNMLDEDQEFFLAEEFRGNFTESTPDHVFLCLYNEEREIKGVSYFKVWHKDEEFFAMAFGIHFRPRFEVTRDEVRQLTQATLIAMQQIGVTAAWTRISSQNFNAILALSGEGFEVASTHSVMMVRLV